MHSRSMLRLLAMSAVLLCPLSAQEDEFRLLRGEKIGELKIDLLADKAQAIIGAKPKVGRKEKWEADGSYHQEWRFSQRGISLTMVSGTKTSAQSVGAVTVTSPCSWATARGIRIGSSEQEVMKAYRADYSKEESDPGSQFVAGSIYGGIIFHFDPAGKVSKIFLGAAAE
jgi:hypothetical protein